MSQAEIDRRVNNFEPLLASCRELREVCAACFRVFYEGNWEKLEHGGIDAFEEELKRLGVQNGFGVRAEAAIRNAEQPPAGEDGGRKK